MEQKEEAGHAVQAGVRHGSGHRWLRAPGGQLGRTCPCREGLAAGLPCPGRPSSSRALERSVLINCGPSASRS